ncbi:Aldehyde/histidinol dehydrogenase [Aspergillus cavernicola]|uniref:aldehyde dehydrogenase (NAD(+)) n=1 Tax=Aspergillus cavernicola TaxID=176166 RepID=A0ABR4HG11_9EURO
MTAPRLTFATFSNIINGEPRCSNKTTFSVDPSTERRLWDVPVATTQDVEDAVQSANDAFKAWSTTPFEQRVSKIAQWKQLYEQYIEEFTQLLMAECGKPRSIAAGEANEILALFEHNLGLRIPEERIEDDSRVIITRHVPVGVVAAICPWNFPLVLSVGKVIPALLTGCSIIVKPSPFTPYSALKMVELAQKVFPPGVVQAIGGDELIGPALVNHPRVNKISFTGSSATGKRIMASAAATLKRVTLELGGNDPAIVYPDVDIEKTAPEVVQGCFVFSGQVCVATKRVYVHESIYELFLKAMVDAASRIEVGKADSPSTTMGPMQNKIQYEKVQELVADSQAQGYKFALTPRPIAFDKGYYLSPSIVDNPPLTARIVVEEQFGPIVPVLKWSDEADVIACANGTTSGLGASVWTADASRAERVGRQMQAGSVFLNSWAKTTPRAMLSGHKESGIGGEWGSTGILEYCNTQAMHIFK